MFPELKLKSPVVCLRSLDELVTPYSFQRYSVGCDKFALANAGSPTESPFYSNLTFTRDSLQTPLADSK